jgi:hypothetical protein
MPPIGNPLSSVDILSIRTWIENLTAPPNPAQEAAIQLISESFEQKIRPLVTRSCIACHDANARPNGLLGHIPGIRQIEWRDIFRASRVLDFTRTFPDWSSQSESQSPTFFLSQIKNVMAKRIMPPKVYKIVHEFGSKHLKPRESQLIYQWANDSLEQLSAVTTSPPTPASFVQARCLGCHNSANASAGLSFKIVANQVIIPDGKTRSGIPYVSWQSPEISAIYLVLRDDASARQGLSQMPYRDSATTDEQALVYEWIKKGQP